MHRTILLGCLALVAAACCRPAPGVEPTPAPTTSAPTDAGDDPRSAATREKKAKIDALEKQLASTTDAAARRALEKQIAALKATAPMPAGCACAPGDPLCDCR
jgi:hypothetical protein